MKEYNSEILKVVHTELEMVDMESCNISIEEAESMINFLNDCLEKMRSYFLSLNSIDSSDEICFFKEIKPEVLGFLLYFNKVHTIVYNIIEK